MDEFDFLPDYDSLALRTESLPDPDMIFRVSGRHILRLMHGVMGIVTEVAELKESLNKAFDEDLPVDEVNLEEELGDIEWYMAIVRDSFGITQESLISGIDGVKVSPTPAYWWPVDRLVSRAGNLMDIVKRHVYYGKTVSRPMIEETLKEMESLMRMLRDRLETSRKEVQRKNIEKLKKRYPDKYNHDDALNRDLQAEREVLEKPVSTGMPAKEQSVIRPYLNSLSEKEFRIVLQATRDKYDEDCSDEVNALIDKLQLIVEVFEKVDRKRQTSNEPPPGSISEVVEHHEVMTD